MPSPGRQKTVAATYERFQARVPRDVMDVLWERSVETGAPVNTLLVRALRRGLRLPAPESRTEAKEPPRS
jgi:hypothetical protein